MKKLILLFLVSVAFADTGAQVVKRHIPDKLVVLTFDDAPVTHFTCVAPILKQYGFPATFFVCEFPPNFQDSTKYLTWKQIKSLSDMGFEIGNHTNNHTPVNGMEREELKKQLKYIQDQCKALSIDKPVTFAYPNYETDPDAFSVLQEMGYTFARVGGDRAYIPTADYPYLVPSYTVTQNNFQQTIHALQAAKKGEIVVLTFHGVPDYEHPWVTTTPELFKNCMQYLHDNQYKVVRLKDLQHYIAPEQAVRKIKPDFGKPLKN